MARKDDLIAEATKLGIEMDGSETIAILEEKIKATEEDVANLPFEILVDKIGEFQSEIDKKESRNKTLEQLNKNRSAEIEVIKKKTVLKQSDEEKSEIKEKNKIINENNRQISKNMSEIMDLKSKIDELDRERSLRIPEIVNSYAIEYIKAKCSKEYICDEIISKITELREEQERLELIEIEKRNELNSVLAKYNVGDISADMLRLEADLDINKSNLSQKLRSYVRAYSKKITQFRKKV
jgi:DNA repair exonuclease SbcCD ATPase subunit